MMRTLDQDKFNKLDKADKANFTANGDGTYSGFFAGSGDNSPILAARSAAGAKALNREMQGIYDKYSDDAKSQMSTSFGDSVTTLYGGGKDLNEIVMGSSAASVRQHMIYLQEDIRVMVITCLMDFLQLTMTLVRMP